MKAVLQQIEEFARTAHGSQRRKFEDQPYIVHPIRVMKLCGEYTSNTPVLAAALLHDVLEDTPVSADELLAFLQTVMEPAAATRTLSLVQELTDRFTRANYPSYNRRKRKSMEAARMAACSADAQTVKYADIIDNSITFSCATDQFAGKYVSEAIELLKQMEKGEPALRERALLKTQECLDTIRNNRGPARSETR